MVWIPVSEHFNINTSDTPVHTERRGTANEIYFYLS